MFLVYLTPLFELTYITHLVRLLSQGPGSTAHDTVVYHMYICTRATERQEALRAYSYCTSSMLVYWIRSCATLARR